jgi:YD repeat-containing protein
MKLTGTSCSIAAALLLSLLTQGRLFATASVVSATPSSGIGFTQTFTLVYSDTGGYASLTNVQVNFSSPLSGANACYVAYTPAGNLISLLNDAGNSWSSGVALGSSGTVQNSQCSVSAANSWASGSGNNLTVTLVVTFSSPFAGTKTIYMNASDSGGGTQWQTEGTWIVGTSGPTVLNTYYTYDALDHLTQVSMPRSNGTQTRTFNYNGTAYLQNATNPENGTVNYTYNGDGTPATKTDAKGQKIAYTYDGYQRVIEIQRYPSPGTTEDLCQRTNFYYDTNPFNGSYSQYSMSRPTAAQYGVPTNLLGAIGYCPTPYQFTEMYSYIRGGAVSRKRLTLTPGLTSTTGSFEPPSSLDTTQTYDNEGKVLTVKYPDTPYYTANGLATLTGPTYSYSYDTQGRPTGLVDNQTSPVTWVNNVQYGPASELRQLSYGVGAGMSNGAPQSSAVWRSIR